MSATATAAGAALVTTFLAALIPIDRITDRHIASWARRPWLRYRAKVMMLHLIATSILAAGATRIGWEPAPEDDWFRSVAYGVAWSVAAVALLRADFSGLRADEATPGFSLLRSASTHFTESVKYNVENAVRASLPVDVGKLHQVGAVCRARAFPPRLDGTRSPDADALKVAMALFAEAGEAEDLGELVVEVVTANRLPRCWSP